jgi:hypothetical protein
MLSIASFLVGMRRFELPNFPTVSGRDTGHKKALLKIQQG